MFICSIKLSKLLKKSGVIAVVIVLAISLFNVVNNLLFSEKQNDVDTDKSVSVTVDKESDEKTVFFKENGIEVKDEAEGVVEVLVPEEFSDEYEKYNELQKQHDFDLSDKKGVKAKQWTYELTEKVNKESVTISILVEKDEIIACHLNVGTSKEKISIKEYKSMIK